MIPPSSFVSSVYCAAPSASRSTSFESTDCRNSCAVGPSTWISPICETSKAPASARTALCSGMTPCTARASRSRQTAPCARRARRGARKAACASASLPPCDFTALRKTGNRRPRRVPGRAKSLKAAASRPHRAAPCAAPRLSLPSRRTECRSRRRARSARRTTAAQRRQHRRSLRTRLRRGRPPKPVAIAVTRTSSPIDSSMTAPKMTFAFESAAFVTTCAASSHLGEAEIRATRDVEEDSGRALDGRSRGAARRIAARAASTARLSPRATPMSAEPASRMIVRTSAKSRLMRPGR